VVEGEKASREQFSPVDPVAGQGIEGGGRHGCWGPLEQVQARGPVDVHPDAGDDGGLWGPDDLGQDPGDLAPSQRAWGGDEVVGPLELELDASHLPRGICHCERKRRYGEVPAGRGELALWRPHEHREEEGRARGRLPSPVEAAPPPRLVVGDYDEPLGRALRSHLGKQRACRGGLLELGHLSKARTSYKAALRLPEDDVDVHAHSLADCHIVPGVVRAVVPGGDRPVSRVLIANRGEIAVRVARACRDLGIASVAVYSEADRGAYHTRVADEAYLLGGTRAADSYLSVERLIRVLTRSRADAVHPGYGFLAENAPFARAVMDAGATWVGPPPDAIEVMGNKISSRLAASKAGVPPVPGTDKPLSGPEEVVAFGEENGWPVAIKAAFGGGGRGMRVVSSAAEAPEGLASAEREAAQAFGRPECYVEKYLRWPRHVEVQVLADSFGNVVHLGTRDCSVQRRHQKLLEEAPAPSLPEEISAAMGEAAVRVAKGCGYVNAGTVELIYEGGQFWFLEMNTRLQVEHPVTEMVSGLDLVRLQLLIASGGRLPFAQGDVRLSGHAIEARVNAEDPAGGRFLPSVGRLSRARWPGGPWVRTDAGYEAGDTVSQHYDNLLAKVIAWGPDRETARRRLLRALGEVEVSGVATTVPVHEVVLSHPDFISVSHSTTWLTSQVDLSALPPAAASTGGSVRGRREGPEQKDIDVELGGRLYRVSVWVPPGYGGEAGPPRPAAAGGAAGPAAAGGAALGTGGAALGTGAGAPAGAPALPGSETVTAPMQGTVVKVLAKVGDQVAAGQAVFVLEAMKMENSIVAETSGTVAEVRVEPGASVGTGDVMAVIKPQER
jgi:acetyl-CoA/propionyl-CoA carboxylase biotin carboxyl carrier protein